MKKVKSKGSGICIAPHCEKLASEALRYRSHSFTLHLHHACLYLVKNSPDGATTNSDNSRLIAAYYSFIDPQEDERLSLLTYSGRFTHINGYSLSCRSGAGQGRFTYSK